MSFSWYDIEKLGEIRRAEAEQRAERYRRLHKGAISDTAEVSGPEPVATLPSRTLLAWIFRRTLGGRSQPDSPQVLVDGGSRPIE